MEIWKDIKGFEGRYQISNTGKVLSLRYRGGYQIKELTPKISNKGYLWVELWSNGKKKNCLIHRMVAEAFIENPNNFPIVNHKDENPLNCNVNNLEWCTYRYNNDYSLKKHPERIDTPRKLFNSIMQFDENGNLICVFENILQIKREKNIIQHQLKNVVNIKEKLLMDINGNMLLKFLLYIH